MKVRLTVTVDIEDPNYYPLDENGWACGDPIDKLDRDEVGQYVSEAILTWGGSGPPHGVFNPSNINSVRVQGTNFDTTYQ